MNLYKVQKMFPVHVSNPDGKQTHVKFQHVEEFLLGLYMTEQVLALLLCRHDIESCSARLGMCEDLLVALEDL